MYSGGNGGGSESLFGGGGVNTVHITFFLGKLNRSGIPCLKHKSKLSKINL